MSDTPAVDLQKEAIDAAKAKGFKVFKTSFDGTDTFFIRPIQRLEYKNLITAIEQIPDPKQRADIHDEKIVQQAVVYPVIDPAFLSKSGAGFVTLLSQEILRISGFTNNIETTEV